MSDTSPTNQPLSQMRVGGDAKPEEATQYVVTLKAAPGDEVPPDEVPPIVRLRRALKCLLRIHSLKAIHVDFTSAGGAQ